MPCRFDEPEEEIVTIRRVQTYTPPIKNCNIPYLGKVTYIEDEDDGQKYLAYVHPGTDLEDGNWMQYKRGDIVRVTFRERIDKDFHPKRGLLDRIKKEG